MTLPTKLPRWDTTDVASTEPSTAYQEAGFAAGDRPPAEWYNWLQQQTGEWLKALRTGHLLSWAIEATNLGTVSTFNPTTDTWLVWDAASERMYWGDDNGVIAGLRDGHLRADLTWQTDSEGAGAWACAACDDSHLVVSTESAIGAYPLPVGSAAVTAVGLEATLAGLTNALIEGIAHSAIASVWVAFVTSDDAAGTFAVYTGTVGGTWTQRYSVTGVGTSKGRARYAESDTVGMFVRGSSVYASDEITGTWTATSIAAALTSTSDICWREEDDRFYVSGSASAATEAHLAQVTNAEAPSVTQIPLPALEVPGTARAQAVASDSTGGMMCLYLLQAGDTAYQNLGQLRAAYWASGVAPSASEHTAADAIVIYNAGDNDPTLDANWVPCDGALEYDKKAGCYVAVLAQGDTADGYYHVHLGRTPPLG